MKVFKKFLKIFFPNHCLSCEKIINEEQDFCSNCWTKLQLITDPKCPICSYPFDVEIKGMQPLCGKCLQKKPPYDKAITIFRYNPIIKKIISDFKYRDQTFLAKKLTRILLKIAKDEIGDADLVIAVPLHPIRLRKRKFNQAALLGKFLSKNIPQSKFYPDFLLKVKQTKSQAELGMKEREKNLKRVFLVNKKYRDLVTNKNVLLVDDVITTGATLESCAKELRRRGAKKITVLTIAKTVFNRSIFQEFE